MSFCVYAIVDRPVSRRLSLIRVNGVRVRSVNARATSAIVAECDGPLPPTVRALRGHDAVVRRIARVAPAVLPVRFGTVIDSDRALAALLDGWSEELRKALTLVHRHDQMTLRLFTLAGAAAPLEQRPDDIPQADEADNAAEAATHPGTAYLTRRARAQALAESAPELEPLRGGFTDLIAAERIVRHDQRPMVLTAYHLIPRDAATAYRRLLRRHAGALGHRVVVSGPWPPYAFVPELRR
jgi:hypothetical protein